MKELRLSRFGVVILLLNLPYVLCSQQISTTGSGTLNTQVATYANLYMRMEIDKNVRVAALKPGEVLEGKLSQGVYSQYKEIFPSGSIVQLTVDKLEMRRRAKNDHWPWVINVFTPRREKYPTFETAHVMLGNGVQVPIRVDFVSIGRDTELHPKIKKHNTSQQGKGAVADDIDVVSVLATGMKRVTGVHRSGPASYTATFEASVENIEVLPKNQSEAAFGPHGQIVTIAAGTQAKVILLGSLSASKSREGDVFQARLVEPVLINSTKVLPEGSVFEGKVVKRTPPRMLSRSGSLMLSFTGVSNSRGAIEPIEATVAGVEVDRRSHSTLDEEGRLRGDRPGFGWIVLNLAATGGIAKLTDDGVQLVIELIVSSATDVSTAGTARIVSACVSGVFLLTRHGRDVVLPKYTEMDIVFDRTVMLPGSLASSTGTE